MNFDNVLKFSASVEQSSCIHTENNIPESENSLYTRGDQKVRGKVLLNRIAFIDCHKNS